MKRMKKLLCMLLAGAMILSTAACGSENPVEDVNVQEEAVTTEEENENQGTSAAESDEVITEEKTGTHVIVDHLGIEVEVPYEVNRIAVGNILPLPSVLTVFFDSAEKIVGMSPNSMSAAENGLLGELYPEILDVGTKQLTENPVADLEYPKLRKSLPKYLTMEQSAALLKAVSGPNEKRDYAILMLFLNCGIRRSELVGLNITDVYEDRIRVVGKGNKERFVYFGSACRKAIDAYLVERKKKILSDNRALFASREDNRISTSAVHRLVKKAFLEAGLDATQYSAHKLRHTAATMMLSGGVDVKTVQEVLGHENLNTTQIYTHIESTELKLAAEANPLSKLDFSKEQPSLGTNED